MAKKKRETTPADLGYKQTRNEKGQFGKYGGQGNRNLLYYYPSGEARTVRDSKGNKLKNGQNAVATNIANAGRNSARRRNRGVKGIRLS